MEHKSSKKSMILSAFQSVIQTTGADISDGDFSAQGRMQQWSYFPILVSLGEQILAVLHKILQWLDVQQEVSQQLIEAGSPPDTVPASLAEQLTVGLVGMLLEPGPDKPLAPGLSAELRAAPAVPATHQTVELAGAQLGSAALPGPVELPEMGSSAETSTRLEALVPALAASATVPAPVASPPEALAATLPASTAPLSAALATVPASVTPPPAAPATAGIPASIDTPPAGSDSVCQSPGRLSSTPSDEISSVAMEMPVPRLDSVKALKRPQCAARQAHSYP
ncbi:uncharacterized protein [Aphelocoma coerulescens]|uniref:uncharacterized protein n=1 Tax=Aphelocoma coerulescens TaxID=39617 RepID=UPI003604338D